MSAGEARNRPRGNADREPTSAPAVRLDPAVLQVVTLDEALSATERSLQTIAQMISMLRAAVPAISFAVEPVDARGVANGASVVFRSQRLRHTPEQVRQEYLLRYQQHDPFHPRHVIATNEVVRGTFEDPDVSTNPANPFFEYADALGLPHFLRVYLRLDEQLAAYVFIGRSHHQRPFNERELAFLELAHPVLESVYAGAARSGPQVGSEDLIAEAGLTPREADVARYAATGMRSREIAELLVLTEATVKTHLARIYRKLGVRGKAELASRLGSFEV